MKTALLSVLCLISFKALAVDIEIRDPFNTLGRFQGTRQLSEAFPCGASAHVYSGINVCQVNCTTNYCTSRCANIPDKSSIFVEECTSDSLKLYGDQGLAFSLQSQDFETLGKTWVQQFLKSSGQFFNIPPQTIEVKMSFPSMVTFIHDGVRENIFAERVFLDTYFQPGTMSYSLELLINPAAKGLDQILSLKAGSNILYLRKGVFDEP